MMKRYFVFFAIIFAALSAKSYDIEYAGCYKSITLEYQSVDENNNPITLSELVTIPLEKDGTTNREVGFFVLSSMVFDAAEDTYSTGEHPSDALLLRGIATEGAMCVQTDGQGFGSSEGRIFPILTNKLNARQAIDGLFAAMDYAQKEGIKINDNYYTINSGYSLAGCIAIAVQRYLETYSTEEEKARFRLKKTICGGSAIDATESVRFFLDTNTNMDFFNYMDGFCKAHSQGSMHGVDWHDICGENIPRDILDGNTALSRALLKALSEEDLEKGWVPEIPIRYIHLANDKTLTYKNTELALAAWGKDKLELLSGDLSDMKWNLSLMHPANQYIIKFGNLRTHIEGGVDFYSGMLDGCLRDTLIASTYGKAANITDLLTPIFDISQGLNKEIPINVSTSIKNGTLIIKSLKYLQFTGEIDDSLGNKTADISVTIRPEIKDSLASKITNVDARGYLHLPIDFDVTLSSYNVHLYGTCNDLYQMIENISAIALHRTCSTKADAEKFCTAFNENMQIHADVEYKLSLISVNLSTDVVAWYGTKRIDGETYYYIEPYYTSKSRTGKITYSKLSSLLTFIVPDVDMEEYLTIDNKSFNAGDYKVMFHVTDRLYGETKLYADILKADSTILGRIDCDVTGVDMNDEGTRQTLNIAFTVILNDYPVKVTGTCSNLNDAIVAAALCYGNLSCPTEEVAQGYADALNNNMQVEFYVAQTNDDGTYPETLSYTDYGPVKGVVEQDSYGAYYVAYVLNWMGIQNLTIESVLNQEIFK